MSFLSQAYKTFANRVSNLKKKLDQLKATLPDPEESPVPSPSMDAPSPTGSESPFQGMGEEDNSHSPAVGSRKPGSPEPVTDNRDVEDMELSDVEDDTSKIIGMFCGSSRVIVWELHPDKTPFLGLLGDVALVSNPDWTLDGALGFQSSPQHGSHGLTVPIPSPKLTTKLPLFNISYWNHLSSLTGVK